MTRYLDHLYQGIDTVMALVAVGLGAGALFTWGGTALLLIVGHFVYDFAVASRPVLPSRQFPDAELNGVVLVLVLARTWVPALLSRRSVRGH